MSPPNERGANQKPADRSKSVPGDDKETGAYSRREAVSEDEARTPVQGESLAESDRESREAPVPASEPTDE